MSRYTALQVRHAETFAAAFDERDPSAAVFTPTGQPTTLGRLTRPDVVWWADLLLAIDDAHDALAAFIERVMTTLATHGVATPEDLPPGPRAILDAHERPVVELLTRLGPVLPEVEVRDGHLYLVAPLPGNVIPFRRRGAA